MMIANLIRAWRHHEELTLNDAAARIGIDRNALYRLESGKAVNQAALTIVIRWALD